jgi:hypothetical protein
MPSVNVVTAVQSGTIGSSSSFEWHNPNTTGSCDVTNVGIWCTASSYSVPAATGPGAPGKTSASTLNVSGDFGFTSPCCDVPNARVHVGARFANAKPEPKKAHSKPEHKNKKR